MDKKQGFLLLAICFVFLLVGAGLLYTNLGDKVDLQMPLPDSQSQTDPAAPENAESSQTEQEKQAAPDFTVYDGEGNAVKLSDFVGTPVVLNFWASWCGPCKSEMPDFDEVWAEYGDRVQFMMVNLTDGSQETKEKAMKYVEEQGYSFPVFYDTDFDAAYTYGVQAVPVTYFVNADGTGAVYFKGAMPKETLLECIGLILPEE